MNLLRSTHLHDVEYGTAVVLDVSHLKSMSISLLYSFIEAWLYKNCKSEWTLEQIESESVQDHSPHVYFRLIFQDIREALYFKLSPFCLQNQVCIQQTLCFMVNFLNLRTKMP